MRAHDMHFTCIPTTKTEECCPTFSAPAFYSPHYPEKGDTKLASHSSPSSSSSPRCKTEKSAFLARFICFNFCAPGPPQIFTRFFFKHPCCFKSFVFGVPRKFPIKKFTKKLLRRHGRHASWISNSDSPDAQLEAVPPWGSSRKIRLATRRCFSPRLSSQ